MQAMYDYIGSMVNEPLYLQLVSIEGQVIDPQQPILQSETLRVRAIEVSFSNRW